MKTDLELQKLLAGEFPEMIGVINAVNRPKFIWLEIQGQARIWGDPVTDREWLWIVGECEKKLSSKKELVYVDCLSGEIMVEAYEGQKSYLNSDLPSSQLIYRATWKQRAVAYFRTIGKMA